METPEQLAELAKVSDEVDEARSKLLAAAAANARRVRAQDEEAERNAMADAVGRLAAIAEQRIAEEMEATGMTREQVIEAAVAAPPLPPVLSSVNTCRRRMVAAGVPELHIQHVGAVDPEDCDALRLVRENALRRPGFLVLGGGKGVRKTGSACWMLGQVEGGVYVDAVDLLDIAFHDRPMFMRLRKAKHIVLDDLGAEDAGGSGADAAHFRKQLNLLWNGWYASAATVVVTANLTRAQFDAYGERIKERMDERGRFFTVGGSSVRAAMRKHWLEEQEAREEP